MSNLVNSKILIVDDAPENIDILSDVLKDFKCVAALNGEKAIKIAGSANQPDLILLDIMMPGMDGFEVCQRLKLDPKTAQIPIIFITGRTDVEDETQGLDIGAVDFIPKPISAPVVLARVRNHLELSHSRKVLEEQNIALGIHNKFMTDSINYAKRIQTAIIPGEPEVNSLFPDSFLIFEPKDIVSGDFFWCGEVSSKKIFAVVDCTGHGVPGAFMSLIGNTLLNDIILQSKRLDPSDILNELDERVSSELNKDKVEGTFDGMDISLCVFDELEKSVKFAGAYRPLLYMQNNELIEIKGDKKSIGDNRREISYIDHQVIWNSGTTFYMFSDGFIDQNNSAELKLGTRKLKELLINCSNYDMNKQKEILMDTFLQHKNSEPQRDDVTFIGIRMN